MLVLSAQIEALTELPYESVYKSGDKLGDLKMKSAVLMDDLIKVINDKRKRLSLLNGNSEITKLKNMLSTYEKLVEDIQIAMDIPTEDGKDLADIISEKITKFGEDEK